MATATAVAVEGAGTAVGAEDLANASGSAAGDCLEDAERKGSDSSKSEEDDGLALWPRLVVGRVAETETEKGSSLSNNADALLLSPAAGLAAAAAVAVAASTGAGAGAGAATTAGVGAAVRERSWGSASSPSFPSRMGAESRCCGVDTTEKTSSSPSSRTQAPAPARAQKRMQPKQRPTTKKKVLSQPSAIYWHATVCLPTTDSRSAAMQRSAVQSSAALCSAVQCSAVQWSAVQCCAVQCSGVLCSAVLYSAAVRKGT